MNDNALTCHGCYWADKCLCDKRCDDFTPIEQSEDIPYYEKNAKDLYKIVTDAGFDALVPQGAFYLWIKSPVADEKELVAAAKEERILMVPGSAFACPGYVRLSFCISNETIQRSAESFANLGKKYFG